MLIMNFYTKNHHVCNYVILELQFQLVFWERALLEILSCSSFLGLCLHALFFPNLLWGFLFFSPGKHHCWSNLIAQLILSVACGLCFTSVHIPSVGLLAECGERSNDSLLMSERNCLRWHDATWLEGKRQWAEIEIREVQTCYKGKTFLHEQWSSLSWEVMPSSSLEGFKPWPNQTLSSLVWP